MKTLFAGLVAGLAILVLALHALASGAESDRLSASRAAAPAAQDDSPQAEDDTLAAPNCRYGVGYVPSLPASLSWIPTLDAPSLFPLCRCRRRTKCDTRGSPHP